MDQRKGYHWGQRVGVAVAALSWEQMDVGRMESVELRGEDSSPDSLLTGCMSRGNSTNPFGCQFQNL